MPKKKTKKSAAKRVSVTASGQLKYAKAGRRHLLSSKTRKRKRTLRKGDVLADVERKRVIHLLNH